MRTQAERWVSSSDSEAVKQAGKALTDKLDDIESNLVQVRARSAKDRLKFPVKLNYKLSSLKGVVGSAEGRPNEQSYALFDDLSSRADEQLAHLQSAKAEELAAFNEMVEETGLEAVG